MSTDFIRMDPQYVSELELQLEQREESLKKLTKILSEKEELLLVASEKLFLSEKRKVELETNILTKKPIEEDQPVDDNFVSSSWRAARFESENNSLKSRLVEIVEKIEKCCKKTEDDVQVENRLQELNQFGSGILSSFGLSSFCPTSISSPICGAILSSNALIDTEGLSLKLMLKLGRIIKIVLNCRLNIYSYLN